MIYLNVNIILSPTSLVNNEYGCKPNPNFIYR